MTIKAKRPGEQEPMPQTTTTVPPAYGQFKNPTPKTPFPPSL